MTRVDIEPFCRCGTERIVAGPVVICSHCDGPCALAHCRACITLATTCSDCRATHLTAHKRQACERGHEDVAR